MTEEETLPLVTVTTGQTFCDMGGLPVSNCQFKNGPFNRFSFKRIKVSPKSKIFLIS